MNTRWILFSGLGFLLAASLTARAQSIPPVSDPVLVATYCPHCGWIDVEKGQSHRSDCPYVGGSSSSGSSSSAGSHHTDWASTPTGMIANTITSALGQTLASWIAGESKPDFSNLLEERPELVNTSIGGSNGSNSVVHDERSGRVGIWDNNTRRWLLQPWYYEDLTLTDMKAIHALKKVKKENKWGIIDVNNRTLVPFEFGSIRGFQSEDAPIILFYGSEQKGPCKLYVPDSSSRNGYRLLDEEFEDAGTAWRSRMYVTVKKDGKWGVVGRNGAYLYEPAWEGVTPCGPDETGADVLLTRIETGWGLQIGERVVLPNEYQNISVSANKTNAIVTDKVGKMGVTNMQGQYFLPPVFDKVERFTTKLAEGKNFFKVTRDGKSGLYTDDGVLAAAPVYSDDADFELLAAGAESKSYSQWLKREIRELGSTKGEFETTADFEARKASPALMQEYLDKVMPDPEGKFVEWSLGQTPKHKLTLSNYNADEGCFMLTDSATSAFGAYPLYIPIKDAARFKEQIVGGGKLQEAQSTAEYTVVYDRLYLSDIVFTLNDGTKYHLKRQ